MHPYFAISIKNGQRQRYIHLLYGDMIHQLQHQWYRINIDFPYISVRFPFAGNVSVTVVPQFESEAIRRSIPKLSVSFLHKYSPIPVEPPRIRPLLPVYPRSKTRGNSCFGIPIPLSCKTNCTCVPSFLADSMTTGSFP